jgi:hypothetical protein
MRVLESTPYYPRCMQSNAHPAAGIGTPDEAHVPVEFAVREAGDLIRLNSHAWLPRCRRSAGAPKLHSGEEHRRLHQDPGSAEPLGAARSTPSRRSLVGRMGRGGQRCGPC